MPKERTHCLHGHPYNEANTYTNKKGWRECRVCHRERDRGRYAAQKEVKNAKARTYRRAHRALVHAQYRARLEANPDTWRAKARAYQRRRYAANPAAFIAQAQVQKAKRRGAQGTLKRTEWEAIKAAYGGRCAYCKAKPKRLTVDHVQPLAKGGRNNWGNIVPACASCNRAKGVTLWNVQLAAPLP